MNHLTRSDFVNALQLLARIEALAENVNSFARAVVSELGDYVASELTTLSVCDLLTGHCQLVDLSSARLGAGECLDGHCFEPSLVRRNGTERGSQTRRTSDLVSRHALQRSTVYGDDDRRIRHVYVVAMPLSSDQRTLVRVVLNRRKLDFSERERERLELVRPHLAFLYRHARKGVAPPSDDRALPSPLQASAVRPPGLTLREGEVMCWLACGKTDAEIAALLSISPRTVQKHLEHIYVKLGVETRTAAVMRCSTSFVTASPRKIRE